MEKQLETLTELFRLMIETDDLADELTLKDAIRATLKTIYVDGQLAGLREGKDIALNAIKSVNG